MAKVQQQEGAEEVLELEDELIDWMNDEFGSMSVTSKVKTSERRDKNRSTGS